MIGYIGLKGAFMEYVIETSGLVKRYGAKYAVDKVSIHVAKGDIYGLIGKNGAGKTTLMKLLLGLTFANRGDIKLFGSDLLNKERSKIGALIEAPGLYTGDTAYGNLKRFGILTDSTEEEILDILKLVGLDNTGKKKVKAFSLGMKQRLGIGIALLGSPELLILDEPVNGLDPQGIKEVRDTLLELNKNGVTILISSHLLDELGKIATKFGIMCDGKLVEEISAEEIEGMGKISLEIKTDSPEAAAELIKTAYPDASVKREGDCVFVKSDSVSPAEVNAMLARADIMVSELKQETVALEDFFIKRMG